MDPSSHGQVTYRHAQYGDLPVCIAMMEELTGDIAAPVDAAGILAGLPRDLHEGLLNPNIAIFLAEVEGIAVGLSRGDILEHDPTHRLRADKRCGYIDQMYVRSAWRDRGIGQALMALCEQWFASQGVRQVLLHAAPKAVRLYARLGYLPNRQMFKNIG